MKITCRGPQLDTTLNIKIDEIRTRNLQSRGGGDREPEQGSFL